MLVAWGSEFSLKFQFSEKLKSNLDLESYISHIPIYILRSSTIHSLHII